MVGQQLRRASLLAALAVSCLGSGCHGPGKYGFARTYEPLLSEKGPLEQAQDLPYEQVKRAPYNYKTTKITWFGVVTKLSDLPDGRVQLRLAVRAHQARHLCRNDFADSWRVTVSEASAGEFSARLALQKSEREGEERVAIGSLLKVYGIPTGDYDEHGDPMIEVSYHRHWPRGYYVTTAQRGTMKR